MPPPPPPPPPPLPKLATAPAPVATKNKSKNNAPAKKNSLKKAGPPPPPSRDPATHLMNKGSMSGPETAPKPKRRPSQESVSGPEVAPKPKRQSSQDGRSSVSSDSRPSSVNSRSSSTASRPPSVPKRQSSTQLSDNSPVSSNPSPSMMMPMVPGIPPPPPPPPLPTSEAVYESVDSLIAGGHLQMPPPPKPLVGQSNEPVNDDEEGAIYDYIPPPAVKPKPTRTSALQSNSSEVTITKAEKDVIKRVSLVITDELLQQDEQLARASFHPSVGDTELIDDDVYEDPNDEVYDDTVGASGKAAQFRNSLVKNASLTAVVPQPPAPPPIPGYNNEPDEVYEDTIGINEKAMGYKQHVMPSMNPVTSPPLDTDAIYEEPPAAPPPPPVAPPIVSTQQVPPKAPPPPPPVVQPFVPDQDYDYVPDQDYDELPPKAPAPPVNKIPSKVPPPPPVVQPSVPDQDYDFVPDQDYDELPPPKPARAPPPLVHPFVPDQDYDELPPKTTVAPPIAPSFVPDQDYDELPPKAPVPPPIVAATDLDYDELPPPRPAVTQPTRISQPPPPIISQTLGGQIHGSLPPQDNADEGDIYDVLPPMVSATSVNQDMDYDELPPAPKPGTPGYATVQKKRAVEQNTIPELDMLEKLVQDSPKEQYTSFGFNDPQGNVDELNALGSVLSTMGTSEDNKSSSDEGKWDLPSGDEGKWDLPSGDDDEDEEGIVYFLSTGSCN